MSARREQFEKLYARDPDPWRFETSEYERAKREATLAALDGRRFGRGLEIGCATGLLTERIVRCCGELVAVDVSETALERARARLAGERSVRLVRGEVPADWPRGMFDLVVLSEVLYFLSRAEIAEVSRLSRRSLTEDGVCLLVNWTGPNDLPVGGSEAVELFRNTGSWRVDGHLAEATYRIDRFAKVSGNQKTDL